MKRMLRVAAIACLLGLLLAGGAVAHDGSGPWISVAAPSIQAGQPFELWGADLGSGATVAVDIVAGEESIQVGRLTAGGDGHFTQTMTLPARVPEGYAQLHARSTSGLQAFLWVLVGQAPPGGAQNPAAGVVNQWWSDPSVIVLGLLLGGAMIAVAVLAFRSRRPSAPATVKAEHPRPLPRKGSRRQGRRPT